MRKGSLSKLIAAAVITSAGGASAQPGQPYGPPQPPPYGQPPPPPQQPYAQQPYAQQPGVPYPYQYQPPVVQITPDERELLIQGEITDGQHVGGAALALFFGFGAGQAVQGRWAERGWIFTFGEAATIALALYGWGRAVSACDLFEECSGEAYQREQNGLTLFATGLIGYAVLHVWEIIDAIAVPMSHNSRVRELRLRTGYSPTGLYGRLTPYVMPARANDGGGTAGVTFSF